MQPLAKVHTQALQNQCVVSFVALIFFNLKKVFKDNVYREMCLDHKYTV